MKTPLANDLFVRIEFRSHYRRDSLTRILPAIPTLELEEIADEGYNNHKSIAIERVSEALERVAGFIATRGADFIGAEIQVGKRGFAKHTIATVKVAIDSAGRHHYALTAADFTASPEYIEEVANTYRAEKLLRARKRRELIAATDEVRLDMAVEAGLVS